MKKTLIPAGRSILNLETRDFDSLVAKDTSKCTASAGLSTQTGRMVTWNEVLIRLFLEAFGHAPRHPQ